MKKKLSVILTLFLMVVGLTSLRIMSNPNCPTGKTGAPSLSTGSVSNCTSCHGGNTLNAAGGGITITGLPSTYVPGTTYPFTIKIAHASANRVVWGFAIKAIDTVSRTIVGTWTTTNSNTSIKGTPTNTSGNYELSHANAATSASANNYTYTNLNWVAPALPTAIQSRVKFYVAAVAGDGSLDESGDFVYTTTFTSNQYVAPTPCTFTYGAWTTCSNGIQTRTYTTSPAGCTGVPPTDSIQRICYVPCTFTYGQWTTCSNGTQTRSYTTSPAGCSGVPPTDSIQRTCTVPVGLPNAVTITATDVVGVCDTVKNFSVPIQSGVFYAWTVIGTGNYILNGQGTNSINVVVKAAGTVYVSLSNTSGSIPAVSSIFTKKLPPTPSTLNGSMAPCPNSTFTYTAINPVPTATQSIPARFRWTLPLGSIITSANADSSSVNITFNSNFVGGALAVKNETSCGVFGSPKSIVLAPSKVLDIVSSTGFFNGCIGNTMNFTAVSPIAPVAGGASVALFRWTVPAFTSIVSANADSSTISLQFNTGYKGGALKVQTATACNTLGSAVSKTLTHVGCAAGQRAGIEEETLVTDLVNLFPNPNSGEFTINIQTGNLSITKGLIQIISLEGRLLDQYTVGITNGIINKKITNNSLKTGMYFITYIIGDKKKTIKMYVSH